MNDATSTMWDWRSYLFGRRASEAEVSVCDASLFLSRTV